MRIIYSAQALGTLRRSDKRLLIMEKIKQLADDPSSLAANVVRLQGKSSYRLRVQNWRIIFHWEEGELHIEAIGPRGSVYGD